ncbi:MAG: hypothetical protein EOO45_03575 [Flavobacterium sp.]|nr:MAG: hypothetical protein EOO45_03575 [Flavobacterium sp.]
MRSLLLFLLCFCFISCGLQKINSPFSTIADGLELRVRHIQSIKAYEGGNALNIASKGARFKRVFYELKNTSKEDIIVDFDAIRLMDSRGYGYAPCIVMQNLKATSNPYKIEHKLKAGKSRSFMVQYCDPFNKDEILSKVMAYDKVLEF